MRRSALHFSIPIACALLGLTLIGASGRADEPRQTSPQMLMAVKPTPRPAAAIPAQSTNAAELLVTAAPTRIGSVAPRVVVMEVTAYCPCKKCCGPKAQGITASGKRVNHNDGFFVAADKNVFDFHTKLKIPGYANGQAVPVLDRGGAIKGNKLDLFFTSHAEALKWGRQKIAVTVLD
ncbi:MAG: hypothetical protein QOE14_3115 [Humisphaera sp.]|nr:hypothetical protein [Humisphaera sp.]